MHTALLIALLGAWENQTELPETPAPPSAVSASPKQETKDQKTASSYKENSSFEGDKTPPTLLTDWGWADWGLLGSPRKFRQYATPPQGWFLRDLRYSPLLQNADALLVLKSVGQPDFSGDARIARAYGGTIFEGTLQRNRFFDPTIDDVEESRRTVGRFSLRQSLARHFALTLKYRKDEEVQSFGAGRDPEDRHTTYQDVTLGGRLGSGFLNLSLANWYYKDNLQAYPDTLLRSFHLGYLWEIKPTINLDTSLTRVWLQQAGTPQSRVDTVAVNGEVALSSLTDLELQWRTRHLSLPNVQSAWVREQRVGNLKLSHKWRGWTGQIGFKLQQSDRLRGDQSDMDTPSWQTWEGKLTGRLNRNMRMTLRGSQQVLSHPPTMITSVPDPLYWTQRDLLQFKLEGGGVDSNGYLTYSYRHWRNGARGTDLGTHEITLGTDWQALPNLSLYSELSYDLWAGSTPDTDSPTFDLFLPSNRLLVLGANWTINRRAYLSLSYSDTRTLNENPLGLAGGNTHGKYLTLTGRYRMKNKGEIGLTIAPWRYSDRVVNDLNFNATVFLVTIITRF